MFVVELPEFYTEGVVTVTTGNLPQNSSGKEEFAQLKEGN